jgi:hypothetical protein
MGQLNPRLIRIVGITLAVLVAPALVSVLPWILVVGILPAIVGVALVAVSLQAVVRQLSAAQDFLGTLTISLSLVSLWTLKRMFLDGAWATYLPYYAIAAAIPFVMVQSWLARAK